LIKPPPGRAIIYAAWRCHPALYSSVRHRLVLNE
jgi:hypothetical protein